MRDQNTKNASKSYLTVEVTPPPLNPTAKSNGGSVKPRIFHPSPSSAQYYNNASSDPESPAFAAVTTKGSNTIIEPHVIWKILDEGSPKHSATVNSNSGSQGPGTTIPR
jgi:hypothetical protein